MYCANCGFPYDIQSGFCQNCGQSLHTSTVGPKLKEADVPSFLYALLSFGFPVLGIILFVLWKDEFPLRAKSCLKGLVTSLAFMIVFCALFLMVIIFYFNSVKNIL